LNDRQFLFVKEYLIDLNATQAAIRAGYSDKTAYSQGQRLLKNVEIQEEIQKEREKAAIRTNITIDRCLQEYARLAFLDVKQVFDDDGNLKKIQDMPEDARRAIAGLEVSTGENKDISTLSKVKLSDKKAALDSIMKHLGGFIDRQEHSGPGGGPIKIEQKYSDWTDEELEQYANTGIKPKRHR